MTIDVLSDDVLVEIFFYVNTMDWRSMQYRWHALVNVCRRWRYVVFSSPRRLDLRLEYCGHVPLSEVSDAWQVLPVILKTSFSELRHPKFDQRWENRVATLESKHHNRICEIHFPDLPSFLWERFAAAMQKSFPELTNLQVSVYGVDPMSVLPDSFLGGSAPHLRQLGLEGISFPSVPRLLLSADGLVKLYLEDIPDSGYISPDAMATVLTVMTRLESLHLGFSFPRSHPSPASRPLPPPTRFLLPALTELSFKGVDGYLEDILARIDVPLLDGLYVQFFVDFDLDVPQLHRLIDHAEEFKACDHAEVLIFDFSICLSLSHKTRVVDWITLALKLHCGGLVSEQLSSLSQACNSSFPLMSTLEELEITEATNLSSHWNDDVENARWVELLDPFTVVRDLYVTDQIARRVCGALQELPGERAAEVLPALRNIFVDAPGSLEHIQEAIWPFVAARQLSGHPVAIDHWRKE